MINQIKGSVAKYKTWIKLIFVLSVLIFVVNEIGRIFRDLDWDNLQANLMDQHPFSILMMFIFGFLAVTPMLNYDFNILHFLPKAEYSTSYIIKSGWTVNTFTNLAGFGGFLGASLRANFYGKNASHKQILFAISKIALFLLSGLSIWSLIALILLFGFQIGDVYHQYWIWLVGGALYFPILMIVSHWKDSAFFKDLPLKREFNLGLGSFLEWGFAGGFFLLIGYLVNVKVNLAAVIPLFFVASIAGVISMVPGGLGSFDAFMIIGLGFVGVPREIAVLWLLFYRIFYYILPFMVGSVFFFQDAGKRLNAFFEGLPVLALQKVAHSFLTIALYFSSIMMLLISTVPTLAETNKLFAELYPFTLEFLDRVTNIIVAFVLLGLARGVSSKVKKTYLPTLALLIIAIINTLLHDFSIKLIIFLAIVLVATFFSKKELYRNRLSISWGNSIIDLSIFIGTFILYAIVGFYNSPHFRHPHGIPNAFFFPSQRTWFIGLIGLIVASVTLILVLRYLNRSKQQQIGIPYDAARLQQVIDSYGGNEVSQLAFLRDKDIYMYQVDGEDQLFFLYREKADKLIIMGEPVGNQAYLKPAIDELMREADLAGSSLVFYEISDTLTIALHEIGFDFMKIGEEGYVKLANFSISGSKRKAERALMNKFTREGYSFSVVTPPFDESLLDQLQEISNSWLNGRAEKGFSLGFFDREYLQRAPIAIITDVDGEIVAFANVMPTGDKTVTSIDLMRHSAKAPSGIMDAIFINLFEASREKGFTYFNLGMAPLANVGVSPYSFVGERIAHLIYEYGYRFYGFQGLRRYKEKYVTEWQPKYVAYRRRTSIVFTLLQILTIVNQKASETTEKENRFWLFTSRFSRDADNEDGE